MPESNIESVRPFHEFDSADVLFEKYLLSADSFPEIILSASSAAFLLSMHS